MKRIVFSLAFSSLLAFGPAINIAVSKNHAPSAFLKDDGKKEDGKKKKKKSCDEASKQNCTKGKKTCCAQKAAAQ